MQLLGLGVPQKTNGKYEERIESGEPREEVEPVQKPITKIEPQTKEQVQVEYIIEEPELDVES